MSDFYEAQLEQVRKFFEEVPPKKDAKPLRDLAEPAREAVKAAADDRRGGRGA